MQVCFQVISKWQARVALICKSDDRDDLNNYRPISVLPTVARVFERLIYEQLYL